MPLRQHLTHAISCVISCLLGIHFGSQYGVPNNTTKTKKETSLPSSSFSQIKKTSLTSSNFSPIHVYAKESPLPFKSYSQVKQDLVIMKLVDAHTDKGGKSNNFFVDLAANDAIKWSNSLHLEQNGWNGICIEGNPKYWYGLAAHRNCTVIGAFVGGTSDGVQVGVKMSNGVFGGIVGFDNKANSGEEKRSIVTIATVFEEMSVPDVIDYMSLDVEGAEYFIMENFPFQKHRIRFMTIERPSMELHALLMAHGYKRNDRDFAEWGETLWFHPNVTELSAEEVSSISNLGSYWGSQK
jgi:hypothetical protein